LTSQIYKINIDTLQIVQLTALPKNTVIVRDAAGFSKDSLDSAENETATLWVASVGTPRLNAILTHRQIGGVSWVGTKTLILALAKKDGTSQVYSLLLKTQHLKKLTAGPLDIWPCYAEQKELLFFSHAEFSKPRFERSIAPSLHIWRQHLIEIGKMRSNQSSGTDGTVKR